MSSQAQLTAEIELLKDELAKYQASLVAARQGTANLSGGFFPPNPAEISSLEATVTSLQNNLARAESELQNLTTVSTPTVNFPEEPQPVISEPPTVPNSQVTGFPYDDAGFLNPGWTLDENNNPVFVGGDFVEPATQASADATRAEVLNARKQATARQTDPNDWRVRLSLAPKSNYLYNADNPGILQPLRATNGIVFPYTPTVQVTYTANYDGTELIHSNYKFYQYKSSGVESITITCDFTAQDTFEANYLMAVIHFLRSATKMFYGQDSNPINGTPPPLCYLTGLGAFQFDNHPLVISNFTYSLPNQVDYIRANPFPIGVPGTNSSASQVPDNSNMDASSGRISNLATYGVAVGGVSCKPKFSTPGYNTGNEMANPTYVPTMIQIAISALPIITRDNISNKFSLRDYASGELLQGSKIKSGGGGIW